MSAAHDVSDPCAARTHAAAWLRRALRALRWYVRGVTRADAYERYVAHLQRTHPDASVPTARQFWRDTYAEADRTPTTRCC